jgi:hypothetical protein
MDELLAAEGGHLGRGEREAGRRVSLAGCATVEGMGRGWPTSS